MVQQLLVASVFTVYLLLQYLLYISTNFLNPKKGFNE